MASAAYSQSPSQPLVLRVANQGDVLSLDPHSFNEAVHLSFLNSVFESLVTRDKQLRLGPSLATAWRLKSPTVWQFDLRRAAPTQPLTMRITSPASRVAARAWMSPKCCCCRVLPLLKRPW